MCVVALHLLFLSARVFVAVFVTEVCNFPLQDREKLHRDAAICGNDGVRSLTSILTFGSVHHTHI